MGSGKTSLVPSVIASICIIVYIAAVVFGAVQIIFSINERRALAEQEINRLADRASSAVIFGFMSQAYQDSIISSIKESETLLGVIVSGSSGQFGFERESVDIISWVGSSPRFKPGFGQPKNPHHRVININGHRNGTIQVQYSLIDYDIMIKALKDTLAIILAALCVAVLTLFIEITVKKRKKQQVPVFVPVQQPVPEAIRRTVPEEDKKFEAPAPLKTEIFDGQQADGSPRGLYSPRSGMGWESYTRDRLDSELVRAALSDQDLALLCVDFAGDTPLADLALYKKFGEEVQGFFINKDLVFEKGDFGLAIIVPGTNLEQAIEKAEEFIQHIQKGFPGVLDSGLCIGVSSRSGRKVEPDRLMFESYQALLRAKQSPPSSPIVGFKIDPDKFRRFMERG